MRILSLDYDPLFGADDDVRSSFSSDTSAFDFDVVIWDPEASFAIYNSYSDTYMGLPSLRDSQSSRLKADVERRRSEFKEFVDSGKTLIVVARPPQSCYVTTGQIDYSGTGKNARRTTMVAPFDILRALPIDPPGFQRASGNRIEAIGDGPLQVVIRKYAADLEYAATMTSAPGTAFAKVVGTTRSVASFHRVKSGGLLVILPDTTFITDDPFAENDPETGEKWPARATEFQVDLLDAIEALTGTSEIARPSWTADYSTQDEQKAREAVIKQQAAIEKARNKLTGLQADAESIELKAQLYLGTGRQLELRVRDVLEQLGGKVTEPEPGRDDWQVELDGNQAVVEVKGVSKSAAEKHAAQLEKWVAGSFEQTGVMAKGILVVNTWRDVPLADRTDEDFPAQMLPYSQGRNHCLLTGLDLFAISSEVQASPSRAKHWRQQIMNTSGRLSDVPDWRLYINQATSELAESKSEPSAT